MSEDIGTVISIIPAIDLLKTDDEIRSAVKPMMNGGYCTKICKKCGNYYTDPDGNTNTAEIIQQCISCFDK